ncbi:unnamed protein product [Ambrosiozyma monospora]|uniref:Unnamed protein product n=1 Tax=Ambrosiozyma monospora TaxID=43982 RepID=A0ACB5U6H6_AMBMO|nr:unnamed protein product [Ambrosiozyma monospora]
MLPNIEARDTTLQQFIDQQSILQQLKYLGDNVINKYKSATNNNSTPIENQPKISPCSSVEENKYVVMDVKLNFSDLKAINPRNIPHSSITHAPYISEKDLRSLVTFINDKKYGLSSITSKAMHRYSQEELDDDQIAAISASTTSSSSSTTPSTSALNSTDSSAINSTTGGVDAGLLESLANDSVPPIKFRLVHNLKNFESLDLPSLVTMINIDSPTAEAIKSNPRLYASFINTNKFVDSVVAETLSYLLLYKDELQDRLIDVYTKRSGFEIFFNNLILGNLILVGLGTFVI